MKITNLLLLDPIETIKNQLSDEQVEIFHKSCFEHFLNLNEFQFCTQLLHMLVLRHVHSSNEAMYFNIRKKAF